jgi:hypothetical protein
MLRHFGDFQTFTLFLIGQIFAQKNPALNLINDGFGYILGDFLVAIRRFLSADLVTLSPSSIEKAEWETGERGGVGVDSLHAKA